MNILIVLKKQSDNSDPVVLVQEKTIVLSKLIFEVRLDVEIPTVLKISRNEPELYTTTNTCLDNCVYVDKIIIDNFWEITESNHLSVTEYNKEYIEHVLKFQHTYELSKTLYNNALFFNGSLLYNLTKPIRSMFFNDIVSRNA